MALTYLGAKSLLENNVVELAFRRRNPKDNWPLSRRMLCTNSFKLLGSTAGKVALNFKTPTQLPAYDAKSKNLFITWDIFMQDFRSIPLETIIVVAVYPLKSQKEVEDFWKYFDQAIRPLTSDEKIRFMKSEKV